MTEKGQWLNPSACKSFLRFLACARIQDRQDMSHGKAIVQVGKVRHGYQSLSYELDVAKGHKRVPDKEMGLLRTIRDPFYLGHL